MSGPRDRFATAESDSACTAYMIFGLRLSVSYLFCLAATDWANPMRAKVNAVMLGAVTEEAEVLDDPEAGQSRVTPVMPVPEWLRDLGTDPDPSDSVQDDGEESEFWNTPPRYSLTNVASIVPAPRLRAPSRWHVWSARMLFATISCAVVALLVLELRSLSGGASLTPTRIASVLFSPAPR